MIRIRISLESTEYNLANQQAASLDIPLAEFICRAIRNALATRAESPWMNYAGFVASGNPNSSRSIDEIVY